MLHLLTRLAARHSAKVLWMALLAAIVAGVVGGPVSSLLSAGGFDDPRSDSSSARAQLASATGLDDRGVTVLVALGEPYGSPHATSHIENVVSILRSDHDLGAVVDPTTANNPALISHDQSMALVNSVWNSMSDGAESDAAKRVQALFASTPYVQLGGYTLTQDALEQRTSADLARAEEIAFPVLFLLLILVFRSVVAALLPLLVAGLAILMAFLCLRLLNGVVPLSVYALNITTGLGLGLAIDASLLIVSRFREELDNGHDPLTAMTITVQTAGRTVAFSAVTVAAAMASLLVFPQRFLYSMGVGGVLVAVFAAAAALVVLPALLAVVGAGVDRLAWRPRRKTPSGTGFWYRLASLVMRHPGLVAVLTTGVLIVIALPARDMRLTYVNVTDLPAGTSVSAVATTVDADFSATAFTPAITVVTATPGQSNDVALLAQRISTVRGVGGSSAPIYAGSNTWRITTLLDSDIYGDTATSSLRSMRALPSPLIFRVGGDTAIFVDLEDSLLQHVPLAFTIIGVAILLVLFAATGSVVLPIKAVVMSAVTLIATFGVLVALFQWGWLASLLAFNKQDGIETTEPVLIATIAFGLSTDYGVFLLTRIKEMHDAGHPTRESVAHGLERTGRVVTAAALLFCFAVGTFATSSIVFVKEVGVGAAVAVLIDATIVRAFLVPSLMAVLGSWNWWAPGWLQRIHRWMRLDRIETPMA